MATVVIYSTQYCPYCVRAKVLLTQKGQQFEEIDIGGNPVLRNKMQQLSGAYTVPQIFIAGKAIGGCDELYQLEQDNLLDQLLAVN